MLTADTTLTAGTVLDVEEYDRVFDRYKTIHAHNCGGVTDPEPTTVNGSTAADLRDSVDGLGILDSCVDFDDELDTIDALLKPCARKALGLS